MMLTQQKAPPGRGGPGRGFFVQSLIDKRPNESCNDLDQSMTCTMRRVRGSTSTVCPLTTV
jgi:hypothetical protein